MNTDRLHLLYIEPEKDDQALFALAVDRIDADIWVQNVGTEAEAVHYLEGADHFADRSLHPVPGLILLDWHLQRVGGAFLPWFRHSPFNSIPLAGYSSNAWDERAVVNSGASAFFLKPHHFADLERTVLNIWRFACEVAWSVGKGENKATQAPPCD